MVPDTDWMIGAGLNPRSWENDKDLIRAAYDEAQRLQREKLSFKVHVLAGEGEAYGKSCIIEPGKGFEDGCRIGIISHAGPEFVQAAHEAVKNGYALITEEGGKMAHLVTVFIGQPLRLVRVPRALELYKFSPYLTVDCNKGTVTQSVI